jgi:hypothetical protein
MALIDDLAGILGVDAIEKIKASGLNSRIERGDEVLSYLDKGELPPEPKTTASGLTLEDLTKTLKESFGSFETTFTPKISEIAKAQAEAVWTSKANEAQAGILAESTKWAHQMSQIERAHEKDFNEPLDLDKLNEFAKNTGRPITSPKAVYDEWTRDRRTELEIEKRATEKAKAQISSQSLPGVSPGSATGVRAALKSFGKAVDASGKTRAEVLNEKLLQMERAS